MEEYTNYLAHHGIKGQRWGIRRYQNADGSLTDAGKARLGKYKQKEQKIFDKKYEQAFRRNEKKTAKAFKKYNKDITSAKSQKKLESQIWKTTALLGKRYVEQKAINKMTYSDMIQEKKAARRGYMYCLALGTIPAHIIMGRKANPVYVKEDMRISRTKAPVIDVKIDKNGKSRITKIKYNK